MFNQAFLFLFLLLAIGLIAKNQSLMIAAAVLIVLKLIGADEKSLWHCKRKELIGVLPSLQLQFWPQSQVAISALRSWGQRSNHRMPGLP